MLREIDNLKEGLQKLVRNELSNYNFLDLFTVVSVDPDSYTARIKRLNTNTDYENVPFSSTLLGHGKGLLMLPKPNDIVLVGFLNANPLSPIILGCVFNTFSKFNDTILDIKEDEVFIGGKLNGSYFFIDEDDNIKLSLSDGGNVFLGDFKLSNEASFGQVLTYDGQGNAIWTDISPFGLINFEYPLESSSGSGSIIPPSGGEITTDGDYTVHTFKSNGTFTVHASGNIDVLVVGGGGGGAGNGGSNEHCMGSGGAGGLIYETGYSIEEGNFSVVVGSGGSGGSQGNAPTGNNSQNGGNSSFDGMIAKGGGAGKQNTNGASGGSGGGGGSWGGSWSGGSGESGQGHAGGGGKQAYNAHGGGGGGAGAVGGHQTGIGGSGSSINITGSSVTYATGGSHGGAHADANTGNGGGGALRNSPGGNGGSGVVIIRYKTSDFTEPGLTAVLNYTDNFKLTNNELDINFSNISLQDLGNVEDGIPSAGQILKYDSINDNWKFSDDNDITDRLESTNSTIILSDDDTDQTLTGDLGELNFTGNSGYNFVFDNNKLLFDEFVVNMGSDLHGIRIRSEGDFPLGFEKNFLILNDPDTEEDNKGEIIFVSRDFETDFKTFAIKYDADEDRVRLEIDKISEGLQSLNLAINKGDINLYDGNFYADGNISATGNASISGYVSATGNVTGANLNISNWDNAYNQRVDTWGDGLQYSTQTASIDYNTTNLKITSNQIDTIQSIATTATPNFAGVDIENIRTTNKAAVRYDQLMSIIGGLNWQQSVISFLNFETEEPVSPSVGDRYIASTGGISNVTSQSITQNYIYEWNGEDWTEIEVSKTFTVWDKDDDTNYTFNGTDWVEFGSTLSHNNLTGLQGGTASEYYHLTEAEHIIATQAATSSVSGYLTNTDWATFNGKLDTGGWYDANQNTINLSGFNDDLTYEVPLTFGTGLTRTSNTVNCDITQYTDGDAVSAIKADGDWNASDWDTAYGWGNHASAGYLTNITSESIGDLNDVTLTASKTLTITESTTLNGGTHSGTNTGDQTSIVGISGTKAQFDTACTDGSFAFSGGAFHDGFSDYVAGEHFLQTSITNVSTGLSTGLLKVTTGTGALSVVNDNTANWDNAHSHITADGSSHTYINQNVTTTGTPTFNSLTVDDITIDGNFITNNDDGDINIGSGSIPTSQYIRFTSGNVITTSMGNLILDAFTDTMQLNLDTIRRNSNTVSLLLQGGNQIASGDGNIMLYANMHSTNPKQGELRVGTNPILNWNEDGVEINNEIKLGNYKVKYNSTDDTLDFNFVG